MKIDPFMIVQHYGRDILKSPGCEGRSCTTIFSMTGTPSMMGIVYMDFSTLVGR